MTPFNLLHRNNAWRKNSLKRNTIDTIENQWYNLEKDLTPEKSYTVKCIQK